LKFNNLKLVCYRGGRWAEMVGWKTIFLPGFGFKLHYPTMQPAFRCMPSVLLLCQTKCLQRRYCVLHDFLPICRSYGAWVESGWGHLYEGKAMVSGFGLRALQAESKFS
jgi:hypothetical protein